MAKKKDESKKQPKSEAEKHLKSVKMYIRKTLKANGLYRSEMSQQVEATASVLILFRKVRDEIIEKNEPPIILEKSREGRVDAVDRENRLALFVIDSKNRFTVVAHIKRQEQFSRTRVELCKNLGDINLQHSA